MQQLLRQPLVLCFHANSNMGFPPPPRPPLARAGAAPGLVSHAGAKLVDGLPGLVETGNSVVVIEHNLEVIKTADWIIDLGPEGGDGGGEIVAQGTPEDIVKAKRSYTAEFLKPVLGRRENKRKKGGQQAAE